MGFNQTKTWLFTFLACFCGMVQAQQELSIQVIPITIELDASSVALGEKLFRDKNFSKNQSQACITCHEIDLEQQSHRKTYQGFNKVVGMLNTPTVYNARYNFKQFWNGRVKTLEEAIDDHVSDNSIFNNDWESIISRLKKIPDYVKAFNNSFNNGITQSNIETSLKNYMYSLITPNAPFDLYLQGNEKAISKSALKGYEIFKEYGCISCHQGINIGGNLYQKMGIYKNYFENKEFISQADLGLYNVTGNNNDKFVFKVPSLRNVARTSPYLHDGSAEDLKAAIKIMAEYQVGRPMDDEDIGYVIEFLNTLNGELLTDKSSD